MIDRLYFHNPWWRKEKISNKLALPFKRDAFSDLVKNISLDRVLVLKGPRRTGKTTIFYQIIDYLLKEKKVNPKNICYLSFDDIELRVGLEKILKVWEKEHGNLISDRPILYLFLDEVQYLENWEFAVKLLYDKKYPIKFFVSGSSASLIKKGSETLTGRTFERILLPLNFGEYVRLKGLDMNKVGYAGAKNDLFVLWENYLARGGFPHVLDIDDNIWEQVFKEDIVNKVIYRDLVSLYRVDKPFVLEKMFRYLARISSGIVNLSELSSELKISWESSQNYLSYLKQAYLAFSLPKFSLSPKEITRSLEKSYVIDPGIMRIFNQTDEAKLWETMVARHIWEQFPNKTYFWRKRYEVDVVVDRGEELIPIEIKSTRKVDQKGLRGLEKFSRKFGSKKSIVFYAGDFDVRDYGYGKIHFYPVVSLAYIPLTDIC